MSDLDDEIDISCGEEQIIPDWKAQEEWFRNIFSKCYRHPIKHFELTVNHECMNNECALSTITKAMCRLENTDGRYKVSMIIKQLPKDPFSRFFVTEGQFDLREIKFYTEVIPELKEFSENHQSDVHPVFRVPMCFHAQYRSASGTDDSPVPPESILVLDDLTDNCKKANFSEGLTFDQAKSALDSISFIHAHFLAMKVIDGVSFFERYPFLFQTAKATDSYQQLVERGLPQLLHFLENKPELEAILEALLILRSHTKDIISNLLAPEGPLTLITHTDFWCNNLFFDKRTGICYIIDWQMVTYSRATNDIALLLLSSVPAEVRRKHTKSLLTAYWDNLNKTCLLLGLNICEDLGYTKKDFGKDYRKSELLALLLCIGSVDVALGNPLTEQRLIDVLKDLYAYGTLTNIANITTKETDS